MNYKGLITPEFAKEAKQIAKKHIGIKNDIAKLIGDLAINPTMGSQLGHDFYKYESPFLEQIKVNQAVPELLLMLF